MMLGIQGWVPPWEAADRSSTSSSVKAPVPRFTPSSGEPSSFRRRSDLHGLSTSSSTPSSYPFGGGMEHFRHGYDGGAGLMDISDATPASRMPPLSHEQQVNVKNEHDGMMCASSGMAPQHPAHGGGYGMGGMHGLSAAGLHPHMMQPHAGHPSNDRAKVHGGNDASSTNANVSVSAALASGADNQGLGSDPLSQPSSTTSSGGSSKIPPKKRPLSVPEDLKDGNYWEKRKKNNESAKRSREARRMKEEQIAMRVVYLEQENLQLRTEVSLLKSEIEKLRCMLYNS
ncbi:hypothetical protein CAPTEDRAFT_175426 [Capitella teleta]|uniref:BZIP domain-containing protein n=1 Tax=Capitella teleta TaxID=283909 RepID=R7UN41_CAPTE|nr:hypothetical protein CAPTEDRAFT_175426 [Capitella teleta]|eukprot:ELU04811.1 hypothetical protein CAPTEDRAFT_175426 [Capitella teleta]